VRTLARADDKAELLRRLEALRADSRQRWGRMTAPQVVCHLSDAFLMAMGRRPVSPATGALERTVVKWIALYLPVRWPGGRILTRPEIDQAIGGTRPGDFAADVAQLAALTQLFTATTRNFEWEPHPIFGRMSESDWMRWGYLHMDHHLRQFGA
jgi:hypothetical protein